MVVLSITSKESRTTGRSITATETLTAVISTTAAEAETTQRNRVRTGDHSTSLVVILRLDPICL